MNRLLEMIDCCLRRVVKALSVVSVLLVIVGLLAMMLSGCSEQQTSIYNPTTPDSTALCDDCTIGVHVLDGDTRINDCIVWWRVEAWVIEGELRQRIAKLMIDCDCENGGDALTISQDEWDQLMLERAAYLDTCGVPRHGGPKIKVGEPPP